MNSSLIVFASREQLAEGAARCFENTICAAVAKRGHATVVLPGGKTPAAFFELLGRETNPTRIPWRSIDFFWSDERAVPPDDPASNYGLAHGALLAKVPIDTDRVHRIVVDGHDVEAAAQSYERMLADFFHLDTGQPPPFDLVILGLGVDGHTASLFPGTFSNAWNTRLVIPALGGEPRLPRVTLTPLALSGGRHVAFLVSGAEKATALRNARSPAGDPNVTPALAVRGREELVWLVDRQAAGQAASAQETSSGQC